jgi:hypothetical protein
VLSVDDTLARHTGKKIASAGMHRDPLLPMALWSYTLVVVWYATWSAARCRELWMMR